MWPTMMDGPICPGVGEYSYQPASLGCPNSGGTCIVPSLASPRCSSFELMPTAATVRVSGTERGSVGPSAASSC